MSSLLQQRDRARNHLEASIINLQMVTDWRNLAHHHPSWRVREQDRLSKLCKYRAERAKKRLAKIDKKIMKIVNHCTHSKVEMYATLMLVFKPELREEVEKIITFT